MFVCGVDLGGTTTKIVVVDGQLRVLDRSTMVSDVGGGPADMVQRLTSLLAELESAHGTLGAVGISMAGLVNARGVVVEAPNLPAFLGFDMVAALQAERPQLVLTFENDVNCAVVGEHRHGAGRGFTDVCMLSLGTGVGGGIVIDGQLFHGAEGLAGEFGHLVIDLDGPICTCGKRGHVEAHLSTSAIIGHARRLLSTEDAQSRSTLAQAVVAGEDLSPRLVSRCAGEGDELSCRILALCGRYLGAACASVAHALHPQKIIIGGGVSGAGTLLLEPAKVAFAEFAMESARSSVQLGLAELGSESAAIGAARLALDALEGPRRNSPET